MNGRPAIHGDQCSRCGDAVREGTKVCGCGHPTRFMSFEERNRYETEQWKQYLRNPA